MIEYESAKSEDGGVRIASRNDIRGSDALISQLETKNDELKMG